MKQHEKQSPVTTSNIYYDKIMSLQEFKQLPKNRKMLVLDAYRKRFSAKEIAKEWQLSNPSTVYYYYRSYLSSPKDKVSAGSGNLGNMPSKGPAAKGKPTGLSDSTCAFVMQGEYKAGLLKGRFEGLARMMANNDSCYEVEVRVREVHR